MQTVLTNEVNELISIGITEEQIIAATGIEHIRVGYVSWNNSQKNAFNRYYSEAKSAMLPEMATAKQIAYLESLKNSTLFFETNSCKPFASLTKKEASSLISHIVNDGAY